MSNDDNAMRTTMMSIGGKRQTSETANGYARALEHWEASKNTDRKYVREVVAMLKSDPDAFWQNLADVMQPLSDVEDDAVRAEALKIIAVMAAVPK